VPYVSIAVAFVLKWLLRIMNYLIELIHDLPYSLTITTINLWQVLIIFCAIFFFALFLNDKKFKSIAVALCFVLLFIGVNIYINYRTISTNRFVVFADNKNSHIDFITGKNHFIFTTDSLTIENAAKSFWLNNKLYKPKFARDEKWFSDGYADFLGKRILILNDESFKYKKAFKPLPIDYLVIGNKIKPRISEIFECVNPQKVIVDKSISSWYTNDIRQVCHERNIPFYSIAQEGAYILNLPE